MLRLAQTGSVKDRLAEAYLHHLNLLEPHQLPEAYRADFTRMRQAMQRERPLPKECPVRASIRKMSNEEASGYATLIVALFGAAARAAPVAQAPRAVPSAGFPPVSQRYAEG